MPGKCKKERDIGVGLNSAPAPILPTVQHWERLGNF